MRCRALKTFKTRELHIKRGSIYNFEFYASDMKEFPNQIYHAIVVKDDEGNALTTNCLFFEQNFISQEDERDGKIKDILK